MSNQQGGFYVIKPSDLQDPTLFALNAALQYLNGQVSQLIQASRWKNYIPIVTANGSMTASGLTVKLAQYLKQQSSITLLLDISIVLGGTPSNAFYITLPVAPSSATSQYGCGAAIVVPAVSATASTITNGLIHVSQYNGANFSASTYEVVLSTTYPIS